MKKKKQGFYDDGRVIANMNVEGMPWYRDEKKDFNLSPTKNQDFSSLSKKGKKAMLRGILCAAFSVGIVYFGIFALFILFCIHVWFK